MWKYFKKYYGIIATVYSVIQLVAKSKGIDLPDLGEYDGLILATGGAALLQSEPVKKN